tara:strand:+ start:162 stop:947 length:786 start_codon:yes stop_codon:yes gene_type:complete
MKLEENKKILIIACPRAATRFTYNLLNHFNIKVGHEETKKDGAVSSLHLYTEEKFDYVVHQIRDPLKCIASLHKINWQEKEALSWATDSGYYQMLSNDLRNNESSQSRHSTWISLLDRIKDGNMTRKCMKAYLEWNKAAKEMSTFTYRIEELVDNPFVWASWSSSLGLTEETYEIPDGSGYPDASDFDRARLFKVRGHDKENHLIDSKNIYPDYREAPAPELTWQMLRSLDSELAEEIIEWVSPYYQYNEEGELLDFIPNL